MKLLLIPTMALDNPRLARGNLIRIGSWSCWVWIRLGRFMIVYGLRNMEAT